MDIRFLSTPLWRAGVEPDEHTYGYELAIRNRRLARIATACPAMRGDG